jgi:putative GTP pyrophosphokinase
MHLNDEPKETSLVMPLSDLPDPIELRKLYEELLPKAKTFLRKLEKEILSELQEFKIIGNVYSRVKSFDSWYAKLSRGFSKEEKHLIIDWVAIRVVCPFVEDVQNIESLIRDRYTVTETDQKGNEQSYREFGYDSLHLLIDSPWKIPEKCLPKTSWQCEIQIRTTLQDAWAEVEHELVYKNELACSDDLMRRKLAALNASLTLADSVFQDIRDELGRMKTQQKKRRSIVKEKVHLMDSSHMQSKLKGSLDVSSKLNSGSVENLMMQALEAHSDENYDTAILFYSRILSLNPEGKIRSIVYNHRGMAYFILDKNELAEPDFSAAIQADPSNFRAYNNRSACRRLGGGFELAREDALYSLKINPEQADALHQLARCLGGLENYEEAADCCKKALVIDPKRSDIEKYLRKLRVKQLG